MSTPSLVISLDRNAVFKEQLFPHQPHLTEGENDQLRRIKLVLLEAIKKAVLKGVPKTQIAIFFDEPLGNVALSEAVREEFFTGMAIENQEQPEFDFEHGDKYKEHIQRFSPQGIKIAVSLEKKLTEIEVSRLYHLSVYCRENNYPLFIEVKNWNPDLFASLTAEMHQPVHSWIIPFNPSSSDSMAILANIPDTSLILRFPDKEPVSLPVIKKLSSSHEVSGIDAGYSLYSHSIEQFFKGRIDGYRAAEDVAENLCVFYRDLNDLFANHQQ